MRAPRHVQFIWALLAISALLCTGGATAENIRGSSTGPTSAPGYDHPEQSLTMKDVKPAPNMYPVLQRPEQSKQARDKLAALQRKTGKKPFSNAGKPHGEATEFVLMSAISMASTKTVFCWPIKASLRVNAHPTS